METYIEISLSRGLSVIIRDSGTLAKYRYDIYGDGVIIGAMGLDEIIEDKVKLQDMVEGYLGAGGRF